MGDGLFPNEIIIISRSESLGSITTLKSLIPGMKNELSYEIIIISRSESLGSIMGLKN